MFKNRKKYLIPLAVLQLLVFNGPNLAKVFHHHELRYVHCPKKGSILTSPEKNCLICAFEFVSFIHEDPTPYHAYLPHYSIEKEYPVILFHREFINYFSLRAPPIS